MVYTDPTRFERERSRKRGKLIVLIGPSGAGKTSAWNKESGNHICEQALAIPNYIHLSSDDLRESMFGDRTYQRGNGRVFRVLGDLAVTHLCAAHTVVLDATHVTMSARYATLNNARLGAASVVEYHVYDRKDKTPWHGLADVVQRQEKIFKGQIDDILSGDAQYFEALSLRPFPVKVFDHREYKCEEN